MNVEGTKITLEDCLHARESSWVFACTHRGRPCVLKIDSRSVDLSQLCNEHDVLQHLGDIEGVPTLEAFETTATASMSVLSPRGVTLANCSTLSPDRLEAVCRAVVHVLQMVHKRGFVHADICPDNIIITPCGGVCVIDWGVSRRCGTLTVFAGRRAFASDTRLACLVDGQPRSLLPHDDFEALLHTRDSLLGRSRRTYNFPLTAETTAILLSHEE